MNRKKPKRFRKLFAFFSLFFSCNAVRHGFAHELELQIVKGEIGKRGGALVVSQRSEPKTLNPLIAFDLGSRSAIGLMNADLIHINRFTQQIEAALAKSWTVSPDGRDYMLHLRSGLRFSDGYPCDADDVIFTFNAYLDGRVGSVQKDLLTVGGKPVAVTKVDALTVRFALAQRDAAAERLFDGIAILPRHLLQDSYLQGTLSRAWNVTTEPGQIAGMGPFRLAKYVPGERIVLERNPYYWKQDEAGNRLPYLQAIAFLFVPNADAEALRFEAGDTDMINGLTAADFAFLEPYQQSKRFHLYDLGPGLEYYFLFFNQNKLPSDARASVTQEQFWFQQVGFRKAISSVIDRDSIVRIGYRGRAHALSTQETPGNRAWVNRKIPDPVVSLPFAKQLLLESGFSWTREGLLKDALNTPVKFSIAINAGNPQQVQMATFIQQDLKGLGITVTLDALDFHIFLNRIFTTYRYDAAIIGLSEGDADPNAQLNVLSSTGGTHVWQLTGGTAQPGWQLEIDRLMRAQMVARDYRQRKHLYDAVQQLVRDNVPAIFLVSPDALVGAKDRVGNFKPAVLSDRILWNAEQLFLR